MNLKNYIPSFYKLSEINERVPMRSTTFQKKIYRLFREGSGSPNGLKHPVRRAKDVSGLVSLIPLVPIQEETD